MRKKKSPREWSTFSKFSYFSRESQSGLEVIFLVHLQSFARKIFFN